LSAQTKLSDERRRAVSRKDHRDSPPNWGEIVAQKDYFLAAAKGYPSGSRSSGETIRVAPAASSPFKPRSTVTSTSNAADSTGSAVWRDAAEARQWVRRS
jgi:hypothetical protein